MNLNTRATAANFIIKGSASGATIRWHTIDELFGA